VLKSRYSALHIVRAAGCTPALPERKRLLRARFGPCLRERCWSRGYLGGRCGWRCWADRGDPRKQHGQHLLPPCYHGPRRHGIAGVIDPETLLLMLGQASAATAVFVEMTGDSFRDSASSCGNRRAAYALVVASALLVVPHKAKHSDETRNAGRTKRLNRIIGAGR